MMITNKGKLPEMIVNVIKGLERERNKQADYSVTELIRPPFQQYLIDKHRHELHDEAENRLWAMFGTAVHKLIAESNKGLSGTIIEKRYFMNHQGLTISGQIDYYYEKTLWDYKTTSAWSFVFKKSNFEWDWQTNLYAFLMKLNGTIPKDIKIFAMFKDWFQNRTYNNPDYPRKNWAEIDIPVYDDNKIIRFVNNRLRLINEAKKGTITDCKPQERWETDTIYAIMKKGRKSAVNARISNEQEAIELCEDLNGESNIHFIEKRPGERKRCGKYCVASRFCSSYQEYIKEKPA